MKIKKIKVLRLKNYQKIAYKININQFMKIYLEITYLTHLEELYTRLKYMIWL